MFGNLSVRRGTAKRYLFSKVMLEVDSKDSGIDLINRVGTPRENGTVAHPSGSWGPRPDYPDIRLDLLEAQKCQTKNSSAAVRSPAP
jgi:hypothetical protein